MARGKRVLIKKSICTVFDPSGFSCVYKYTVPFHLLTSWATYSHLQSKE